jgi:hypothetical protein
VYATPDDMPETSVKIITEAKEISLDLKTDQDIVISDGSVLLQSYVNKTTLTGTIVNYIPDSYSGQFKTVKINN